ncbi:MAG TPA: aminomethyl-transferring glycine dehydrogenase subunit GcvPA [Candidatus Marinimicrobia bacterium]|nr:aminomethyl-transferring glycine dehydrogenase subunit GcvPA [Candidatus Neomarinimicrobiota bacterium]
MDKYIPNTPDVEKEILQEIGVTSFDELISNIPQKFRSACDVNLPPPLSELEVVKLLKGISSKNISSENYVSFLGGGVYDHYIPPVIDFLIARSEFYTAYTPYQPEVSQGTLQSIYEYQSLICGLMGMDISNASLYDGATATAEAIFMACNVTRRSKAVISKLINPFYFEVLKTYLENRGVEIEVLQEKEGQTDFSELEGKIKGSACLVVQSPNFFGVIEELDGLKETLESSGSLFIMIVDPISLGVLKSPGEYGTDIAVAEGQSLGIHQSFGGPFLGIIAARKDFIRNMPGRIAGMTEDAEGKRAFTLVLQTREQHIRRERATSNICTNQALMALSACIFLSLVGKKGIRKLAELCVQKSHYLSDRVSELKGFELVYRRPFFKEFVVSTPVRAMKIVEAGLEEGFFPGVVLGDFYPERENQLLIAVTEKRSMEELDSFVNFLKKFEK